MKTKIIAILIASLFFSCNEQKEKAEKSISSYINIPATDSGLPFALEQYYTELNRLIGQRANQPILLNNTITTFDIDEDAPFYTEGLFRLFADRKFSVAPENLGTAIQADRFSGQYENIIEIATTQIDANIDPSIRQKIDNYLAEIRRVRKELIDYELDVTKDWNKIVTEEGLDPNDTDYQLRRLNFYESIFYADRKKEFTSEIQGYRLRINQLRSSAYNPSQQKLIRSYEELAEAYKIARPWSSRFEKTVPNVTYLTFADPRVRTKQICDISPSAFPAGVDLVKFQQGGDNVRSITVNEDTKHTNLHSKTWKARGKGKFNAFGIRLGGSGGGSNSKTYKEEFKELKSFKMGFSDISEIFVDRGLWFDPSLFTDAELKVIFDKIPGARDLKYVSVSLIIGRGLTLDVNFSKELQTTNWSKTNIDGKGGVSLFGFQFGGGGSSTKYDYKFKLSDDKKTVKFEDDKKHCRLLAIRLESIYPSQSEDYDLNKNVGKLTVDEFQKLKEGEISYGQFQSDRIRRYKND